jgi:hypothetical protein
MIVIDPTMLAEAMPRGGQNKVSRPVFGLEPGGPAGRWCVFCAAAHAVARGTIAAPPHRGPPSHTLLLLHILNRMNCLLWPNFCGTLSFFLPCLVLPVESTTSISPLSLYLSATENEVY